MWENDEHEIILNVINRQLTKHESVQTDLT